MFISRESWKIVIKYHKKTQNQSIKRINHLLIQQLKTRFMQVDYILKKSSDANKPNLTTTNSSQSQNNQKNISFENYFQNQIKQKNIKSSHLSSQSGETLPKHEDDSYQLSDGIQLTHLQFEQSQNLQKQNFKQAIQYTTKESQQSETDRFKTVQPVLQSHQSFKLNPVSRPQTQYSILNSETLNPKCSKCQFKLLCPKTPQICNKWMQCVECLEISHEPCQISPSVNQLGPSICFKCIQKKKPLLPNRAIPAKKNKNVRNPKKSQLKKFKAFKQRTQSYFYLDSFLSGFSYKLAITEEQVRKQIKSLQMKERSFQSLNAVIH